MIILPQMAQSMKSLEILYDIGRREKCKENNETFYDCEERTFHEFRQHQVIKSNSKSLKLNIIEVFHSHKFHLIGLPMVVCCSMNIG